MRHCLHLKLSHSSEVTIDEDTIDAVITVPEDSKIIAQGLDTDLDYIEFFTAENVELGDYIEYKNFINDDHYSKVSKRTTLTANKIDLTDTTPNNLSDDGYVIQCSAKSGEGMLDILEMIANLESNFNSTEQSQQFVQNTDKGENKGKKANDEKAESILKEFRGKF